MMKDIPQPNIHSDILKMVERVIDGGLEGD